jgi:hypothetical protein
MRTSVAPTATAGSSEFCGDPISGVAAKGRKKGENQKYKTEGGLKS